jgi:hypothetical protein
MRWEREITDCDCDDETPNHRLCAHCSYHRKMDEREKADADFHNERFRQERD